MAEIEIKYSDISHRYEVNFDEALKTCNSFIAERLNEDMVIENDDDYKFLWKCRTEINNKAREISSTRKQAVKVITGKFEADCKALEKQLITASNIITEKLKKYKADDGEKTRYKLTLVLDSKNGFEKLKKMALQFGAEIKEEIK